MTLLSDIAQHVETIAADANDRWESISEDQLLIMIASLNTAAINSAEFLVQRLGNSIERAEVEIRRAQDLPASVLKRRVKEAADIINADREPNVPQHAAIIAIMIRDAQTACVWLERRQTGKVVN